MSPERLAQLKAHVLNPPSASLNREWMLELVEELERLWSAEAAALRLPTDALQAIELPMPAGFTYRGDAPPPAVEVFEHPKPKKAHKK